MPSLNKKKDESVDFFEKEAAMYGAAGNLASNVAATGSASAKVRQAEWQGVLQWDDANHQAKAKKDTDWSIAAQLKHLGMAELQEWMEGKSEGGYDTIKCKMCEAVCTPEHLEGAKHKRKMQWHTPAQAAAPCTSEGYYCPPVSPGGAAAEPTIESVMREWGVPIKTNPLPKHYVVKNGGPYCMLCNAVCTAEHVEGKNHKKKVSWEPEGSW